MIDNALLRASQEHATNHGQAIEAMIRVYLERTGHDVGDVELVEQRNTESEGRIEFSWFVRKRLQPPKGPTE